LHKKSEAVPAERKPVFMITAHFLIPLPAIHPGKNAGPAHAMVTGFPYSGIQYWCFFFKNPVNNDQH
jgi:hypothetical protein